VTSAWQRGIGVPLSAAVRIFALRFASGVGASGLQRRQGARSLRDRQLPTALPALDRTSIRRHGANTRPKGHSGPSACK